MRLETRTLILVAVAGCSYEPRVTVTVDAEDSIDVPELATSIDAPAAPTDPTLRLALDFDDPGLARDSSEYHHDATIAATTPTLRDVPVQSPAVEIDEASSISIPNTPDFDVEAFTVVGWVNADDATGDVAIVDVARRQIALKLAQGRVRCTVRVAGTERSQEGASVSPDEWTLVACSFAAGELCATVRRPQATMSSCTTIGNRPIDTGDPSTTSIGRSADLPGSAFRGSIDSIRIYARALSSAELAILATR